MTIDIEEPTQEREKVNSGRCKGQKGKRRRKIHNSHPVHTKSNERRRRRRRRTGQAPADPPRMRGSRVESDKWNGQLNPGLTMVLARRERERGKPALTSIPTF